jgi:hypothetical protein
MHLDHVLELKYIRPSFTEYNTFEERGWVLGTNGWQVTFFVPAAWSTPFNVTSCSWK